MSKNHKEQLSLQSSDSSNIQSIDSVAIAMKESLLKDEIKQLQAHNIGLSQVVDKLLKQIEEKTNEIRHLQDMLAKSVPIIGDITPMIVSDEEVIAEYQLKALKSAAMVRDLTLDEVKRFDLLVKNKRLAQGNVTTIEGKKGLPKELSKEQLIQIASNPKREGE